jgi:hypothetical protein
MFIACNTYCRQYLLPTILEAKIIQDEDEYLDQSLHCLEVSLTVAEELSLAAWFN